MAFFSSSMAIDLGTVNTLVYVKDKGVVLNEPSVVAMRNDRKEVLAVGDDAKRMIGRTPGNIVAVKPLKDGVISDFDTAETMLRYFIKKSTAKGAPFSFRSKLIVCVPCSITEVEKRAVESAARSTGVRDVILFEEPLAAAMGAGLPISEARGSMIVDLGGGTTEIAVISLNGIVVCKSLKVGGNHLDEAIVQHVKKQYNIVIGEMTAEQVKIGLGSAYDLNRNEKMMIRGRNAQSGLPAEVTVHAAEIKDAIAEPIGKIVDALKQVMQETPPELSADIIREGMTITGGTSLLRGMNRLFSKETGISVKIANEPMQSVALGAGLALDEFFETRKFMEMVQESI
jgi:rod shape-determining protein MreB